MAYELYYMLSVYGIQTYGYKSVECITSLPKRFTHYIATSPYPLTLTYTLIKLCRNVVRLGAIHKRRPQNFANF